MTTQATAAKEWSVINRERGKLIDKGIAGTLTGDERTRLEELQAYADEYIHRVAPRSCEALDELESRLGIMRGGAA